MAQLLSARDNRIASISALRAPPCKEHSHLLKAQAGIASLVKVGGNSAHCNMGPNRIATGTSKRRLIMMSQLPSPQLADDGDSLSHKYFHSCTMQGQLVSRSIFDVCSETMDLVLSSLKLLARRRECPTKAFAADGTCFPSLAPTVAGTSLAMFLVARGFLHDVTENEAGGRKCHGAQMCTLEPPRNADGHHEVHS